MGVLYQIPPQTAQESKRREVERLEEPEEMKKSRRRKPSDYLSKKHMRIQRLKQQTKGLHGSSVGPLCIYYSY